MTFSNGSVEMSAVALPEPSPDLSVRLSRSFVCAGVHQEVGDEVVSTVGDGVCVTTTNGVQLSSESSSNLRESAPRERAPRKRAPRERPARERRPRTRG